MSRTIRARWVLPISTPPIENGWVSVAEGRIVAVGRGRPPHEAEDLGDEALLPGLVNAHTHLELSWLAGRVPPAASMDAWITTLVGLRRAGGPGREAERRAAFDAAVAMREAGTVLVGDISNSLLTPGVLADTGLAAVVFHELLGFSTPDPVSVVRDAWARIDREAQALAERTASPPLTLTVVAHAPYSVSPALFAAILAQARGAPLAIHLAESPEEVEFLRTGGGPIRRMLEQLGAWTDTWRAPQCDPVRYAADLGYLRPGTLVVHAVRVTDDGLDRLRKAGAVIVTCPRSNEWVGAGVPPLERFYASGVPIAVGTDSLASSPSLSVFDELAAMRRLAPGVAAAALLESATRIGATALGFGEDYGTITSGRRAALIGVRVPSHVADVEEYLVSGVRPGDVRTMRAGHPLA
jgi:cytosine/adenosine deaminase-related metal-dependent hydrolase